MTREALLWLAVKSGKVEFKTSWRRRIWTTSLVPRLIIPWAASAYSPQLRTLLSALSLAAAGCDPQQEPSKPLSPWAREQWSLRWAGLWCSAASDLGRQGESVWWGQGEIPPSLDSLVLVAAGGYVTTAATVLSSIWKGSRFCQGMVCEGEVNSGLRMFHRAEQKSSALGDINCVLRVTAEQFSTCFKTVVFFFLCVKNFNVKRTPLGLVNHWLSWVIFVFPSALQYWVVAQILPVIHFTNLSSILHLALKGRWKMHPVFT